MLTKDENTNFDTMCAAAVDRDLALAECFDRATGERVAVVCVANPTSTGGLELVPFARLLTHPNAELEPPETAGGVRPVSAINVPLTVAELATALSYLPRTCECGSDPCPGVALYDKLSAAFSALLTRVLQP